MEITGPLRKASNPDSDITRKWIQYNKYFLYQNTLKVEKMWKLKLFLQKKKTSLL